MDVEMDTPHSSATIDRLMTAAERGDPSASSELLPLVYEELRRLAASRLARLAPGQTLQPTALVHEAYLQVARDPQRSWAGRRHFFGAAAHAMRDILVDHARRRASAKRGGGARRVDLEAVDQAITPIESAELRIVPPVEDMVALDAALRRLEREEPRKAEIVMLRYFAGLSVDETAAALETSPSTIDREWRYLIARLHREIEGPSDG